jgi:hypothetical protein
MTTFYEPFSIPLLSLYFDSIDLMPAYSLILAGYSSAEAGYWRIRQPYCIENDS